MYLITYVTGVVPIPENKVSVRIPIIGSYFKNEIVTVSHEKNWISVSNGLPVQDAVEGEEDFVSSDCVLVQMYDHAANAYTVNLGRYVNERWLLYEACPYGFDVVSWMPIC